MTDIWRVRTAITGGPGGSELSTLYFDQGAGTAQNAADAVRAFWNDLRLVISGLYTMQVEPLVYSLDLLTGQPTGVTATSTLPVAGVPSSDPAPTATQGLIRWHTGAFTAGREIIGKTFIPGVTEANNTNGKPDSGYLSALSVAAANLGSSGPPFLQIWSRKHHVAAQAGIGTPWTEWAVLRSRRQ